VFSILPDLTLSEDVVQETFLTATAKACDYRPGTNFFAWVCSIARFHVLHARRSNLRAARESFPDELIEVLTSAVPDDAFESSQAQALSHCYERLPRHMRELIRLRYVSGFGPGEIGDLLKRTSDSVNATLGKARGALRECVQRELRRRGIA
jgi:RNA polymerase sigma-70 factor (ECF subfamily)